MATAKGTIGILTGGGDVPGLNPAIRSLTFRALREGYRVVGIRRGWAGLVDMVRDESSQQSQHVQVLDENLVDRMGRTGGTFLHTSRTSPSKIPRNNLPVCLQEKYTSEINDVTPEVLKNLEFLKIDYLIPIGGDDTLSYAQRLHQEGVKIVAIPKTMDNDVAGTDYCIGFSTCVTRTIELAHRLRTCASSHERFLVIEVFGRYAGFTALLPTMAGAADRCLLPESPFDMQRLTELLMQDKKRHPDNYAVVLVSEGARMSEGTVSFESDERDQYGHKKLGGIGDKVAHLLKELSSRFDQGRRANVINQRLSYLVRCGDPDALDSIVPMAFSNLAMNLIVAGKTGRLVALRKGCYDSVPIDCVTGHSKTVNVQKYYDETRLRPRYETLSGQPLFIMTSEE